MNRSSTRSQIVARAASLALAAALLAPAAANADALPLYIGDPTANEKPASGIFLGLGEGNVKGLLGLAAEKRWGNDDMHARYYSPNLGRFMSVDPVGGKIGSSQSWNRYAYVENNPVNLTDPTGKVPVIPIIITFFGGIMAAEWGNTPTGPDDPVMTDPAYQNNGYAMMEGTLAGAAVGIAVDQCVSSHEERFVPDSYHEKKENEKAPGQSSPLATHDKVDKDGNQTTTTYDEFGDRSRQFEVGDGVRHGEGYHEFEYDAEHPRQDPGGGVRSEHIPFDDVEGHATRVLSGHPDSRT